MKNEVYTIRRKFFEMFLEIINWWTIYKSCGIIICGLHFDKTLRINYEKYDEKKCYDRWYLLWSVMLWLDNILNTYMQLLLTLKF